MPLLVRLIDSEINLINLVVAEFSHGLDSTLRQGNNRFLLRRLCVSNSVFCTGETAAAIKSDFQCAVT